MPTDESNVEKSSSDEAEETGGGNRTERALYKAIKKTLIDQGVEHGHASVRQLPGGGFAAVAGEGTLESATFTPGGGSFGGGGASGSW